MTTAGGCSNPGTMYPAYRIQLSNRAAIPSPLQIDLECSYDSLTNNGSVTATVENTSGSAVSGNLHFALTEHSIPYNWGGLTTVEHVCRDMLPNAAGEAVTIAVGDTIVRTHDFTVDNAWNELNCNVVVFVQGTSQEMYQSSFIALLDNIDMEYFGLTFTELNTSPNQIPQPGDSLRMDLYGKNNGSGVYTDTPVLTSSDPYITILSTTPQTVNIGPGDLDTVLNCDIALDPVCPSPHLAQFELDFGGAGGADTFDFLISHQTGFSDDIESGQGEWTHSGPVDNWHISDYSSHSPSHSWYCGLENTHQYSNLNDASLVSPYFVATPDSNLTFWHQYGLEPNYDYSFVEIDNSSGWWHILDVYNGNQATWIQATYSLADFAGQTVRLRFRFVSDQSVTASGWYVDDVDVPVTTGVNEFTQEIQPLQITVGPNPFSRALEISLAGTVADVGIVTIYDATGRLIETNEIRANNSMVWHAKDSREQPVPAGIYFIRFRTGTHTETHKVLYVK
ncbi:MAG: Omp28-related outer membrane protein [candidate division WOR-3 bacterium]|nr:MAG: Omp28-related outer membrane protein [candidate division WOR-3 bacterium]